MRLKNINALISAIACIGAILFLSGCVTQKACQDKFGTQADTVTVTTTIIAPADSASGTVNCDTIREGYPVYFYSDKNGSKGATVKLEKQKDGSVKASADCPPVEVQKEVKCPPVPKFIPKEKWYQDWRVIVALLIVTNLLTAIYTNRK
jgi:hypothetical protein